MLENLPKNFVTRTTTGIIKNLGFLQLELMLLHKYNTSDLIKSTITD